MADYTIASPNGGTWTIQSANTARVGRFHDLAFLAQGAAGTSSFTKSRGGFLPSPAWQAGTQIPGGGQVFTSTGLAWSITPFGATVERSSLVGPYVVVSTAVGFGSLTTPDGSQTTVYRLDLQVLDGALGDNGGTSLTSIKVTRGTPGAGVPVAPSNSIPLGWWTVPANTENLTQGMWTDARKSSAMAGGLRALYPGDLLADAGFMLAEMRDNNSTQDRWNAATATWETVAPLPGLHEVDLAASASIPTNTVRALGWTTVNKSSPDLTLSTGGPGTVASGVITWNRSGLWQVGVSIDCPFPSSASQFTAFRVRSPGDTGTIVFGAGGNNQISDGGPIRITAGTQWSVIVVQQTGSTQLTGGRFRAALLRG